MTDTCHIVFPLYPGVTQLDFTAPHQFFNRMPGAVTTVASVGGVDIEGDGLVFTRLTDLASVEACDVLCVPWASEPPQPCWMRPSCARFAAWAAGRGMSRRSAPAL